MQSGDSLCERLKEGGIGRSISFSGLALLAICFFLPQMQYGGGAVTSPVNDVFGRHGKPSLVLGPSLPFLFGLVGLCLYAVRAFIRSVRGQETVALILRWLCIPVVALGAFCSLLAALMASTGWLSLSCLLFSMAGMVIAVGAIGVAMRARQLTKTPLLIMCCGAGFLDYFIAIVVYEPTGVRYGLVVSILASALVAIGGLWEAITASRAARASPVKGQPAA